MSGSFRPNRIPAARPATAWSDRRSAMAAGLIDVPWMRGALPSREYLSIGGKGE
jgi:hypothetical protein